MKVLTLPLKSEYFDAIVSGEKLLEYRLTTPFWRKRLEGKTFDAVEITKGYPAKGDASRRNLRAWAGYELQTITHPHFGPDPVEVFAIHVGKLLGVV